MAQAQQDKITAENQLKSERDNLVKSALAQKSAINSFHSYVNDYSNRSDALYAFTMTGSQSGPEFGPRVKSYITRRASSASYTKQELESAHSSFSAMFSNSGTLKKDFTQGSSISFARSKLLKHKAMLSHVYQVSSVAPGTFPNWPSFPIPSELMTHQEAEYTIYEHIGLNRGRNVVTNIRNTMLIGSFNSLKNSAASGLAKVNVLLTKLQEIERANIELSNGQRSITDLESAVQRQDALVSEAERSVSQAEESQQQAQQALDEANTALNQAQAGLTTAQQSMDEAQASLSQATREREAAEMLLSEARVHLAQAKTDKAQTESELLAARTTLNQASVQFGKAHSLSVTPQRL
ncbi:hypothetical protein [Vibrio coralliilyticus]|uniref:hypothetical protein n=1 Tax=Vibrio coralliilyticus TaxID=190893 RepID=UPI0002E5A37F|nr:hypothetical protein [Vibrio coralliilyticus]